jgi:hypothetical protein
MNLVSRMYRFGKFKVEAPKVFTCVGFSSVRQRMVSSLDDEFVAGRPQSASSSKAKGPDESIGLCDVFTGGDNGVLYLWRCGLCVNAITISAEGGSLDCLQVVRVAYGSDVVVCGGAGKHSLLIFPCWFHVIFVNRRLDLSVERIHPGDIVLVQHLGLRSGCGQALHGLTHLHQPLRSPGANRP